MTAALTPQQYGQLALGLTVGALAQQMLLGPLAVTAQRFFASAMEAGELRLYLGAMTRLHVQAGAIVTAAGAVLCLLLPHWHQEAWLGLVIASVLFALLSAVNATIAGMENAWRRRPIAAAHQAIGEWLRFSLALLFIRVLGARADSAMIGYVLGAATILLSQTFFFGRMLREGVRGQATGDSALWRPRLVTYAWPFVTWGLFGWLQLASDRWALQWFGSPADVGLYAVLYQVGFYPISLATGLLVNLISPVLFARAGDGSDPARLRSAYGLNLRLVAASALLSGAAALIAAMAHARLFGLLTAPRYFSASPLLPWMVLSGGIYATSQIAVLSILSGTQTQRLIAPKVVTAIAGAAASVAGAARWGLPGVVAASVAFSFIYLTWILVQAAALHRAVRREPPSLIDVNTLVKRDPSPSGQP